jgi:ubiquinone/menaquinone biosynthesis C-methylase UbiE
MVTKSSGIPSALLAADRSWHKTKSAMSGAMSAAQLSAKGEALKMIAPVAQIESRMLPMPYADSTFDAAFSLFCLMFFLDRKQGFAEIYRTLKPGGSIAITSWVPADQSPAMQTMFGALRAIKPDMPQPQCSVTTLENPERFKQEMEEAGFHNIEIHCVTKAFPAGSTAEFWDNMVKGSAPDSDD